MRAVLAIGLAVLVVGCGEQPAAEVEAPTTYYVQKADLNREEPDDICRSKDAEYLQKIISRIVRALPEGTEWGDFEDFNATPSIKGDGMDAVVRFEARTDNADLVKMFAIGPFDPTNCDIVSMRGGVGSDPHDPRAQTTFEVR